MKVIVVGVAALVSVWLVGCGGACSDLLTEHEVSGLTVRESYKPCDRSCVKPAPRAKCDCGRRCPCWDLHRP